MRQFKLYKYYLTQRLYEQFLLLHKFTFKIFLNITFVEISNQKVHCTR